LGQKKQNGKELQKRDQGESYQDSDPPSKTWKYWTTDLARGKNPLNKDPKPHGFLKKGVVKDLIPGLAGKGVFMECVFVGETGEKER